MALLFVFVFVFVFVLDLVLVFCFVFNFNFDLDLAKRAGFAVLAGFEVRFRADAFALDLDFGRGLVLDFAFDRDSVFALVTDFFLEEVFFLAAAAFFLVFTLVARRDDLGLLLVTFRAVFLVLDAIVLLKRLTRERTWNALIFSI